MPTAPVTDDYIDSVINANEAYNPNLNKTQGVQLRALVKALRDSLEQEIADSAASLAPQDSPAFTGSPSAPTQPGTDSSDLLATTAFVKNAVNASGAIALADNGLTVAAYGAPPHLQHIIELGGALNADTVIDSGTHYFRVGNALNSPAPAFVSIDSVNAQTQVIGGSSQLNLQQDNVELFMGTAVYGHNKSLLMNDSGMTVADNINHKGLENAGDYEANFTARSLVTKQYVDALTPEVDVLGTEITGFVSGAGTLAATDTILQAIDKLDGNDALKAPLDSPVLTGTPTAPTQIGTDSSTLLATTAFVHSAIFFDRPGFHADNGLTLTKRGSGPTAPYYVELGGTLNTLGADIDTSTTSHFRVGDITGSTTLVNVDAVNAQAQVIGGTSELNLQQDNVALTMATAVSGTNKSIAMNDTAMTVADTASNKGLENADDYEANFTARSLVTKQYVDGNDALKAPLDSPTFTGTPTAPTPPFGDSSNNLATTNFLRGAIGSYAVTLASNGLTAQRGAGLAAKVEVRLGGALTGYTDIDTSTTSRFRVGDITGSTTLFSVDAANAQAQLIGGTSQLNLQQDNVSITMATATPGTNKSVSMSDSAMTVADGVSSKGLENAGDYEANFTARSLVTKQYVDSVTPVVNVLGTPITGFVSGAGTVAATDNILQAIDKLDGNNALKAPLSSPTFTGTVAASQLQVSGAATFGSVTGRVNRRVLALSANSATPAVNTDNYDVLHITGQTATITGFVMTGTPVDGDMFRISITGTASVPFTLGSSFEPSGGVALSTTTNGTNRLDMGFVWNTETSKWRQIAVA